MFIKTKTTIMKKILCILAILPFYLGAQFCTLGSNVVLFTNYDGGILNINIDVDIPNLKIGVVSYEAVQINFSGPFVNNITEVRYAGYNSNNDNCNQSVTSTSFSGLPVGAITSITFAPPSPIIDPYGNNSIICGYECNPSYYGYGGGCNTSEQIVAYFYQVFNENTIYSHRIQYNCWSGTQNISNGGNCCSSPPPPPPPSFNSTTTGTNNTCASSCDGTATANPVGGSSPYSYTWGSNANNAVSQTVTGLCPGTYSVTITDANGTQITNSVTISSPPAIAVIGTVSNPLCFGEFGSIQLSTSGGVAPYTVNWNGLNPLEIPAGSFAISIQDANNCVLNYNFTISEPTQMAVTGTVSNPLCFGEFGSIQLSTSGGVAPYIVNWNGLNPLEIPAGSFAISIQDANNCVLNYNFTVSEPTPITGDMTTTPDLGNCEGTVSIDVQGGISPYSYSWLGLPSISSEITNLCVGEYCVEVTDFNGCEEEFCATVANLVNITEIEAPFSNIIIVPNPSIKSTTLKMESVIQHLVRISVVDATGREIFTKSVHVNESSQTEISIDAPSGIYFINISSEAGLAETLKWVRY